MFLVQLFLLFDIHVSVLNTTGNATGGTGSMNLTVPLVSFVPLLFNICHNLIFKTLFQIQLYGYNAEINKNISQALHAPHGIAAVSILAQVFIECITFYFGMCITLYIPKYTQNKS